MLRKKVEEFTGSACVGALALQSWSKSNSCSVKSACLLVMKGPVTCVMACPSMKIEPSALRYPSHIVLLLLLLGSVVRDREPQHVPCHRPCHQMQHPRH